MKAKSQEDKYQHYCEVFAKLGYTLVTPKEELIDLTSSFTVRCTKCNTEKSRDHLKTYLWKKTWNCSCRRAKTATQEAKTTTSFDSTTNVAPPTIVEPFKLPLATNTTKCISLNDWNSPDAISIPFIDFSAVSAQLSALAAEESDFADEE